MKIVAVVQARTASTRLPGKTLLPVRGKPMLQRMLERVAAAATELDLIVATTTGPEDDGIRDLTRSLGLPCYSGSPDDLLDRHVQAARLRHADLVVKIPSDCPLISPEVMDRVLVDALAAGDAWDYDSNLHPQSYPDGNDVEVIPMDVLLQAHAEAAQPHEREHTTPFIWDQPDRFRLRNLVWETGRDCSRTHRFTVDYPEDFDFITAVYNELWSTARPVFTLEDIMTLLAARPDIHALNARYLGVNWYRDHLDRLQTVGAADTRRPEDAPWR